MPKKNKRKHPPRPHGYYPLSEIRELVKNRKVNIWGKAQASARNDFGWGVADILKAFKMLKEHHFYKSEPSKFSPLIVMDFYKAHINGEDIYTHFYIDDSSKKLIISSFKQE